MVSALQISVIAKAFFKHNLSRFENSFEGHSGSIFYYIPVLLVGTMPFTGLLIAAFLRMKSWIKSDTTLFLVIWFAFVFIFFSFSGTKLPHYVIYGYTPLFIIMALQFPSIRSPLWIVVPPALLMLLLIFLPEIANAMLPKIKDPYAQALIEESGALFGWRYKMEIALLLAALALFAEKHRLDVVMWGINVPSFMVYSKKIVPKRDPKPGEIVLTKITKLKEVASYQPIFKKYGIVLVRIESMKKGKE